VNCRTFHELLTQTLDAPGGEWPAGLAEHLRGCRSCAALCGAARRLAEGLPLLAPPAPPSDLADRIAARVLRQRLPRRFGRRRVAVPLAVAACLLVAVGARLWWARRPAELPPAGPDTVAVEPAEPVDPRGSVAEAGRAVAALTGRAADEAVDKTRWLLAQVRRPALPGVSDPVLPLDPPGAHTLREAGAGVGAGLGPVTSSARRAVDLFLRDLPPMPEAEDDKVTR
jgi:hypothetical protein